MHSSQKFFLLLPLIKISLYIYRGSTMFSFGIDNLLTEQKHLKKIEKKRLGLVAHPASINRNLQHSLDLLKARQLNVVAAFGPQHGMRGDKQDNMIESEDYLDPIHQIPVFSLYGQHRKPTAESFEQIDHVIFDLQDVGCRIYTFISTLLYIMEACQKWNKSLTVLDRPNPAGRKVEGLILEEGWQSFVGVDAGMILRHGLSVAELARYYYKKFNFTFEMDLVFCQNLNWNESPGFAWPLHETAWVNPSPNIPKLSTARSFPGTVIIEGTKLSEGRGTTTPLELIGAPDINLAKIMKGFFELAPEDYFSKTYFRPCYFEPTFQKHVGKTCQGIQLHADHPDYHPDHFHPYAFCLTFLKALRQVQPEYDLWKTEEYEYEKDRLAFDLINGTDWARNWVDDPQAEWGDLEKRLDSDQQKWLSVQKEFLLY